MTTYQFLIIGDPMKNIRPKADTSLIIAREMLLRTYEVHWATDQDFYLWDGRVFVRPEKITECSAGSYPSLEVAPEQAINSYDGILIRKDPPFDNSYMSLCWLLALEENNVPILNRPSLLLRYHEKMLPFEAVEQGFLKKEDLIPSFLPTGPKIKLPANFPRGPSITKPWLGHGGKDVRLLEGPRSPDPYFFLQPYQKEVQTTGDQRIFILDGEVIGSFTRIPAAGEVKSNLVAGGSAAAKVMNKRERALAEATGEFLKHLGIQFAGVDMIHEKISEINITSPTGFQAYHEVGGSHLGSPLVTYLEGLM